jgi:hypothetical protein
MRSFVEVSVTDVSGIEVLNGSKVLERPLSLDVLRSELAFE